MGITASAEATVDIQNSFCRKRWTARQFKVKSAKSSDVLPQRTPVGTSPQAALGGLQRS